MRDNEKNSRQYRNMAGEEVYRYNAVLPVRVFRLLQEAARAENRTVVLQLTVWIKEGYSRWRAEREKL